MNFDLNRYIIMIGGICMKYTTPVSDLIKLGDPRDTGHCDEWRDYSTLGISKNDIPQLIELLTDMDLYFQDSDLPEVWASLHAWRALAQLKAKEAIPHLIKLLDNEEYEDNDWVTEEFPKVFGMIGEEAIKPLKSFLYNSSKEEFPRITVAHGLEQIANYNPDKRQECIDILSNFLIQSTDEVTTLNGFVVSFLVDLKAVSEINVIRDAYDRDIIDISVQGDLEDVELELGLRQERSTPKPNYMDSYYEPIYKETPIYRETKKVGRNEPCPCGSGKKYKKCCLSKAT